MNRDFRCCLVQARRKHKMWAEITRTNYERKGQRYASDLAGEEWALIKSAAKGVGAAAQDRVALDCRRNPLHVRIACQWRLLSKDFPPFIDCHLRLDCEGASIWPDDQPARPHDARAPDDRQEATP